MYKNYFILDTHCHIFPDQIAVASTEAVKDRYGHHVETCGKVEELLRIGTAAGVDGFLVESVAVSPKMVRILHEFVGQQVALHPDRFVGLGTFHPLTQTPEEDVLDAVRRGFHGFKIHPDMQGFKADHEGFLKLYELCAKHGLPVLIHTGDERYDFSNPDRMEWIYRNYPDTQFVGAHFSGYTVWDQAAAQLSKYPNVTVDLSSTYQYMPMEHVVELIRQWGVDRVMYGSDYPMEGFGDDIRLLCESELTPVELRKIFSGNAMRVFRIG